MGDRRVYHVKTDSKIIYDAMQHRDWVKLSYSDLAESWKEVEERIATLATFNKEVWVYKVKGHITDAMVESGL